MNIFHTLQKLFCYSKHQSFFFALVLIPIVTMACSKKKERKITIDTPRPLTNLDVTADSPVQTTHTASTESYSYNKPNTWQTKPPTSFRKINFTFGTAGEVYLSESRGGILPNANRWLGQFGADAVSSIDQLEPISLLSGKGYLVLATGSFKGMRMTHAVDNYQLIGALIEIDGELITIKMTGPTAEVSAQETSFRAFCSSLESAQK